MWAGARNDGDHERDAGRPAQVSRRVVGAAAHARAVGRHRLDRELAQRRVGDAAADARHEQTGHQPLPARAGAQPGSVMNSVWAISRFVPPVAASSTTRRSLGVRASVPERAVTRGRMPDRRQLCPRAVLECPRAAASGQGEPFQQRLPGLGPLASGPEGRALTTDDAKALARADVATG